MSNTGRDGCHFIWLEGKETKPKDMEKCHFIWLHTINIYCFIIIGQECQCQCKKTNIGMMPLHDACQDGHKSVISLLLENGADLNAQDEDGETTS